MDEKAATRAARKARILGASGARLALVKSSSTTEDSADAILQQSVASLEFEDANATAKANMQASNDINAALQYDSVPRESGRAAIVQEELPGSISQSSATSPGRDVGAGGVTDKLSQSISSSVARQSEEPASTEASRSRRALQSASVAGRVATTAAAELPESAIDKFKRNKAVASWLQRRDRAASVLTVLIACSLVWVQFQCISFPFKSFDGDAAARSRDYVLEKISERLEGAVESLGAAVQSRYQIDQSNVLCRMTESFPLAFVSLLLARITVYAIFYPVLCAKFPRDYRPTWLIFSSQLALSRSESDTNALAASEDPIMKMVGQLSGLSPLLSRLQWWYNVAQPIASFAWASVGDIFLGIILVALGYSVLQHAS